MEVPNRKRSRSEHEVEEPETKIPRENKEIRKLKHHSAGLTTGKSKKLKCYSDIEIKRKVRSEKPQQQKSTPNKTISEKPNWSEFKKKKKELRILRKQKKGGDFTEIVNKVKKLWEKLRRSECPKNQREALVSSLHRMLKGNLDKIVFCHDLTRIVQWMLKLGPDEVKQNVIAELVPHVPAMLESKYACFTVKSMLMHGNKESRRAVVHTLYGKVVKLASHAVASKTFEEIYSKWASGVEKLRFQQEFYGEVYKQDIDSKPQSLSYIVNETREMKDAALSSIKANLSRLLEKHLYGVSLLHTVLAEYLQYCNEEDREEICTAVRDSLLEFSTTKDGAVAAIICIFRASNKEKKLIMKKLKGNYLQLAKSEYGHLLLLALFDAVDDTVFLKKTVIPELLGDLLDLVQDKYGRKVVLYVLAYRNPRYFLASFVKMMEEYKKLSSSKKEAEVRIAEIQEAFLSPLLEHIASNARAWMSRGSIELVTCEALKCGKGDDVKKAFQAIANYLCDLDYKIAGKDGEMLPIEHGGTHVILRWLIKEDENRNARGEQEMFSVTLGEKLASQPEIVRTWITINRGCFLLLQLLETGLGSVVEQVKNLLEPLSSELKKQMKNLDPTQGAPILYNHVFKA